MAEGELHAAATLFREAADFARRHNLPYERHYRFRAAETHAAAGRKSIGEGVSVELAENAYAAAIQAFNELGAFSDVGRIYLALAELPVPAEAEAALPVVGGAGCARTR